MNIDPLKVPSSVSLVIVKILVLIHQAEINNENINSTTMAVIAGSHKVSICQFLFQLETRGLIIRQAHPDDRRQSLFTLSRKGSDLLASWQSNLIPSASAN